MDNIYLSNNVYLSNLPFNEIVVTLEDFEYGKEAKCTIPSLITAGAQKIKKQAKSIMNKDESLLGLNKKVESYDYINIMIPKTYADNPLNPEKGKKGTKFILSFVGGGQQIYTICGRV